MDIELKKNIKSIKKIIKIGLKEDFSTKGDITSSAIFSDEKGKVQIIAKQDGVLSGIDIAELVFLMVDKTIIFKKHKFDSQIIHNQEIIATVEGRLLSLLKAERTALNFLGYLSGISTKAAKFVELTSNKTSILDTRKILAGYRVLAKYAARCGGAKNHRYGLYDMIMIKDNHIDGAKGITNAVKKVRDKYKNRYKIEVETRNLREVEEALNLNVDRIMLDNMDFETAKEALKIINNKVETEISGNMDEEKIIKYSSLMPTYISIGSLTHSVKSFDFSMKFID